MLAALVALTLSSTPAPPAAAAAAAVQLELVDREHSLSALLPPVPQRPRTWLRTLPLLSSGLDFAEDVEEEFEPQRVEPELIADLVREQVSPEEWEYEGRALDLFFNPEPQLFVRAPAAVHAQVEDVLQRLAEALRPRLRVAARVQRLEADGDGSSRAGALLDEFRLDLTSGVPAVATSETRMRFVFDYDVEIAQSAAIHQPIVQEYPLGNVLVLRADRDPLGGAVLTFALRSTWQAEPTEELDATLDVILSVSDGGVEHIGGGGLLQSPHVGLVTMAGGMRLAPGTSGSVYARRLGRDGRPADGVALHLSLDSTPAPQPVRLGERMIFVADAGGAFTPGFALAPLHPRAMDSEPWEDTPPTPQLLAVHAARDAERLEMLVARLQERDEEGVMTVESRAGRLFLAGPNDAVLRAQAAAALNAPPVDFPGLELRAGDSGLAGLAACAGEAFVIAGEQSTYLVGCDVDVANNAQIANPNLAAAVDGYAARLSTSSAPGGAHRVTLQWKSHLRTGSRERVNLRNAQLAHLHLPSFVSSWREVAEVLSAGQDLVIGDVKTAEGTTRLSAKAR